MKKVARDLVSRMAQLTVTRAADQALANAQLNQPYIKRTILDLQNKAPSDKSASAIVIGAGPSLHRKGSIAQILNSGYKGTIVSADGALGHCLRSGLVPDYVVTLDPHPTRIVRWFGDPELTSVNKDDYFRRQDLDPHLSTDELARNKDLIELVNKHGPKVKHVISTSVSNRITRRCLEAGMELYWWNPLYDDFDDPDSLTRRVYRLNKVPCMATGGNWGSAAWVFTHAVLGKKGIAVVGLDFSYPPGTPLWQTQYYPEIMELFGEKAPDAYIKVQNPYLGETWFSDPAYYWYRQNFLQMAREADCTTFNCTEGGILFGKPVQYVPLVEFLSSHGASRSPEEVLGG